MISITMCRRRRSQIKGREACITCASGKREREREMPADEEEEEKDEGEKKKKSKPRITSTRSSSNNQRKKASGARIRESTDSWSPSHMPPHQDVHHLVPLICLAVAGDAGQQRPLVSRSSRAAWAHSLSGVKRSGPGDPFPVLLLV